MAQVRHHGQRFETVEAFDDWVARQPDRWELHDGVAVAMAPERADHTRIKARTWQALDHALQGTQCEALVDGLSVPGPGLRRFQPDVLVTCGDPVGADAQVVTAPVIIVEVLSLPTENTDTGLKLESYFALPSLQHYLILSSTTRRVIHHRRSEGPSLLTRIYHAGTVELDPPGISVDVEDFYRGAGFTSQTA